MYNCMVNYPLYGKHSYPLSIITNEGVAFCVSVIVHQFDGDYG